MNHPLKKALIILLNIIVGIVIAVAVSFLIFGTDTIIIADKMPPVDIVGFRKQVLFNITIQFCILLIPITLIAVPQTIILKRKQVVTSKKDIIVAVLLWVLPLIACFIKLSTQYGYTY